MTNDKEEITIALIKKDVEYIRKDVVDIKNAMASDYITRLEFDPIKKIVYGLVGLILTAVMGALVGLVIL